MATRSRIGYETASGKIKTIYCHWDGYPEGVGKILQEKYTNPTDVEELIKLGDISSLRETLEETEKECYEKEKECREDLIKEYEDIGDVLNNLGKCGEEYTYIFMEDYSGVLRWTVIETPYPQTLEDYLKRSQDVA